MSVHLYPIQYLPRFLSMVARRNDADRITCVPQGTGFLPNTSIKWNRTVLDEKQHRTSFPLSVLSPLDCPPHARRSCSQQLDGQLEEPEQARFALLCHHLLPGFPSYVRVS